MKAKLNHLPVLAVYLIGSQAREQAREDSDVDIAVVVENRKKSNLRQIINSLSNEFPIEKLHLSLIDLRNTSPLFLYQIAKEGKLLYEREKGFHLFFFTQALRRYFDDQYRLSVFQKELIKRIKEGKYAR